MRHEIYWQKMTNNLIKDKLVKYMQKLKNLFRHKFPVELTHSALLSLSCNFREQRSKAKF